MSVSEPHPHPGPLTWYTPIPPQERPTTWILGLSFPCFSSQFCIYIHFYTTYCLVLCVFGHLKGVWAVTFYYCEIISCWYISFQREWARTKPCRARIIPWMPNFPSTLLVELHFSLQFSHSVVSHSAAPWTAACQASLSITNSQSLLKLMSIESVMPSNHHSLSSPSPPDLTTPPKPHLLVPTHWRLGFSIWIWVDAI